jgi:YggT family protein
MAMVSFPAEDGPCAAASVNRDVAARRRPCSGRRIRLRLAHVPVGQGMPMTSIFQILLLILDVVWFVMIAHIIMSWLINFQVLNLNQDLVRSIWFGLNRLLEPIYDPIRRILPDLGGIDLAPLVGLLAVYAIRIVLMNNIAAFY